MSCVIVLGCYRSGTSAAAGVLHYLGVFMGENFDLPNENNVKGYYEDIEFKNFHKKFDSGELDKNPSLMDSYSELIKSRESLNKIWGLKDPLLCTNLSNFTRNLNTDHKMIVCRRPIEEIYKSLAISFKENKMERFKPLVEFYVERMNFQIYNYNGKILEINYEEISNPINYVEKIANFVNLPVNKESLSHVLN
jgi:hypothetical protein